MANAHLHLDRLKQLLVLVLYLHLVVPLTQINQLAKAEVMLVIGVLQHQMVQHLLTVLLTLAPLNQ